MNVSTQVGQLKILSSVVTNFQKIDDTTLSIRNNDELYVISTLYSPANHTHDYVKLNSISQTISGNLTISGDLSALKYSGLGELALCSETDLKLSALAHMSSITSADITTDLPLSMIENIGKLASCDNITLSNATGNLSVDRIEGINNYALSNHSHSICSSDNTSIDLSDMIVKQFDITYEFEEGSPGTGIFYMLGQK